MTPRPGEAGSTTPLVLVLLLIATGFTVVAAAATSLHLDRLRLLTLADGAALAAAESFALDDVEVRDGQVLPRLEADAVAAAAAAHLAASDTAAFPDVRVAGASTPDGRRAAVTLTATWRPPLLNALLPVSVPLSVTSTAGARFR